MPNPTTLLKPKPTLKPKQTNNAILSISPKPPTQHRTPPISASENISRTPPKRERQPLICEVVDYDKLTPNQQMKWDQGMYGSIHLRSDVKQPYYLVRWEDPIAKIYRATKLDRDWDISKIKWRKLLHPD
jgi:hypothetical protein